MALRERKETGSGNMQLQAVSRSTVSRNNTLVWWQTAVLVLLTAWLYAPIAFRLIQEWWLDPNYVHGFLVPAFALFLVWEDRHRLATLRLKPSWWGLVILLFALLALAVGAASSGEFFLPRISLLLLIAGLVVFFAGWRFLLALSFPLLFLLLMIPSTTLYSHLTMPMQLFASKMACFLLNMAGIPAGREGNVILLPAARMEVAEACSGIRSLFSLLTLAIIYSYLLEKKLRVRVLLVLAAIPISVIANAVRVATTGVLIQHWGINSVEGTFHLFCGWLIFIASMATILLLHALLGVHPRDQRGALPPGGAA
jgi:exosortase